METYICPYLDHDLTDFAILPLATCHTCITRVVSLVTICQERTICLYRILPIRLYLCFHSCDPLKNFLCGANGRFTVNIWVGGMRGSVYVSAAPEGILWKW